MHDFCKRTQDRGMGEMIARLSSFCLAATRLELRQRYMEEIAMNYIALKNLLRDQSGQDLIDSTLSAQPGSLWIGMVDQQATTI